MLMDDSLECHFQNPIDPILNDAFQIFTEGSVEAPDPSFLNLLIVSSQHIEELFNTIHLLFEQIAPALLHW